MENMEETGNREVLETSKQFHAVLNEMGFYRKKLGVWGLSSDVFPGNKIKVCTHIKGAFWINNDNARVFTGNYKEIPESLVIFQLMKAIDAA